MREIDQEIQQGGLSAVTVRRRRPDLSIARENQKVFVDFLFCNKDRYRGYSHLMKAINNIQRMVNESCTSDSESQLWNGHIEDRNTRSFVAQNIKNAYLFDIITMGIIQSNAPEDVSSLSTYSYLDIGRTFCKFAADYTNSPLKEELKALELEMLDLQIGLTKGSEIHEELLSERGSILERRLEEEQSVSNLAIATPVPDLVEMSEEELSVLEIRLEEEQSVSDLAIASPVSDLVEMSGEEISVSSEAQGQYPEFSETQTPSVTLSENRGVEITPIRNEALTESQTVRGGVRNRLR